MEKFRSILLKAMLMPLLSAFFPQLHSFTQNIIQKYNYDSNSENRHETWRIIWRPNDTNGLNL